MRFISMDFELSRLPTLCGWAPLIQLGEGLNGKDWCFSKKREFCQQTKFKMHCQLFCNLYPTSLPCRYGFASLHNHMSQFLEIDLFHISHIYVYIHIYVHIPTHTHTPTYPIGFLSLENSDWYNFWCKSFAKQRMCANQLVMWNLQ